MNSKLWIQRTISSCLMLAILATYSMVALAATGKASGELLITANNGSGDAPIVTVNGEPAKSGRTIFSSSKVSTLDNASAVINLGSVGEFRLAPGTTAIVSFNDTTAGLDLSAGSVTVLRSANPVDVKTSSKSLKLNAGETASAIAGKQDDDDDDDDEGAAWWLFAAVFGGAAAVILYAAYKGNDADLGGGAVVISPNR